MSTVNVTSLQREAENYQRDFRTLPYAMLIPELRAMKFKMLEVDNRDIVIVKERNGGASRPYSPGGNINYKGEIMRLSERELVTKFANAAIKDNVLNYKEKRVLLDPNKDKINNKTKKHPLERDIIADQVITVGEDIIDAVWHAKRDEADLSPMGMCDGIWEHVSALTTAGEITAGKGNLVAAGAMDAPADDSDYSAYTNLRDWLREAADPKSRRKPIAVYVPSNSLLNVKDALENKKKGFRDVTFENVLASLREDCLMPKLQLISHYAIGQGDKLMLTTPGNLDIGMNTFSDASFVQVRNPWEDPNLIQFWMQWEIGTRVTNLHKRALVVSDGTITADPLSGDYQDSTGDETVTV